MDRRRIRNRIALLRRELESVGTHRKLQRAKRQGIPLPVVALVGYTNAGKSTLFNALTQAGTVESPQLFATLDPLLRRITLPNGLEAVLSDTVGFVRKLPHDIVAAFRATLEEVRAADLLLHVVDISNANWREQVTAVHEVLSELGVQNTPTIEVCNKVDLLAQVSGHTSPSKPSGCQILISARKETGLDALVARIVQELDSFSVRVELKLPYAQAGLVSRLHAQGRVRSQTYEEDGIGVDVELPRSAARAMREYLVERGKQNQ
jgi:GTP-binding protein HflX